MRYDKEAYLRCIREGHDYWQNNGPGRAQCPYNLDDRAGAWNYGRTQARDGYTKKQAWENFREMEGI